MADAKLYLRPVGLLYGATAEVAVADGLALPLAGGPIAFAAAELIEGDTGNTRMRLFAAPALASSGDTDLAALIDAVTAKRPRFAGLALDRPVLMGIVNVTPNSFSDSSLFDTREAAIVHAAELATAGAAIVDVGGKSTRPGSDEMDETEELCSRRPVIEGWRGCPPPSRSIPARRPWRAPPPNTAPKSSTTYRLSPMTPTACRSRLRRG